MSDLEKNEREEINPDIINLVVARLKAMPENVAISVGGEGTFTVDQIIQSVKDADEVGRTIINMQMNYLRSLKDLSAGENVFTNHEASPRHGD